MSDFNHEHVLGLTGVVIRGNHPYVVLPFMENGDLKTFISNDDNVSVAMVIKLLMFICVFRC